MPILSFIWSKISRIYIFFDNHHIDITQCARSAPKNFEDGGASMGGQGSDGGGSPPSPPTFGNPGLGKNLLYLRVGSDPVRGWESGNMVNSVKLGFNLIN